MIVVKGPRHRAHTSVKSIVKAMYWKYGIMVKRE